MDSGGGQVMTLWQKHGDGDAGTKELWKWVKGVKRGQSLFLHTLRTFALKSDVQE
jgi:hypothetical protein